MENRMFNRKKIASQEELHDYLRVTSPRLWMILGAVALMLVGFIVYAATATIENTMAIRLEVQSYDIPPELQEDEGDTKTSLISARLPMSLSDTVDSGMTVRIGQYTGKIGWVAEIADDNEISVIVNMNQNYIPLPDGVYDAELVLESTTPISFLWN